MKAQRFPHSAAILLLAGTLQLTGCGEETSSTAGPGFAPDIGSDFDEAALVANLTDNIISPVFSRFAAVSGEQISHISQYCQAEQQFAAGELDDNARLQALETARHGWRSSMQVWQQIEVMQIGPLLSDDRALRNKIYNWPLPGVSRCGVDLDVVAFENNDINGAPYDIKRRTASRKGLAALEYLLFTPTTDHACSGDIVPQGWDNRPEPSRRQARCAFAREVASDIHDNANNLLSLWQGEQGYAAKLKSAGQAGSGFASVHDAVNRLSDALFYLDSITKDVKLAKPLGRVANPCGTSICPESVESPLSAESINNIAQNLTALQALYLGNDAAGNQGVGFDDFLRQEQYADVAARMDADIATALALSQAYQVSLAEALENDTAQVTETYSAVKQVTDTLKADFIERLALELPKTSAGDND